MRKRRLAREGGWVSKAAIAALSSICLGMGIYASPTLKTPPKPPKKKIDFNRDVRPIVDKCLSCHGHDPKAVEAGLRLDNREGAIKALEDGNHAIVPGKPDQSMMIQRIESTIPQIKMPPPSSNKILSKDDIKILREWIAEGAEYKQHWAFVKPVRPAIPDVSNKAWPHNAIDYFIEEKLDDNGLKPSPEASKDVLLRRVSLDLTGLPPSPEEDAAFEHDKSPNAYEKVVDRLLASPRYGERMAMDWMDDARYADSNGYQADYERYQYRWRDWVINAFNSNMPYDEFTIDQLAGDLLPHPTTDQIVATGFNRNHRINTEGGVIPEEWRVETVIDRVETTSAVWLGITTGCARCHDHKYDPISQKEFYSLCSYFNNVPESGTGVEQPVNHPPLIAAPYPEQTKAKLGMKATLASLETKINSEVDQNLNRGDQWQPSATVDLMPAEGQIARYQLGTNSTVNTPSAPAPAVSGTITADLGRSTGAVKVGSKGFVNLGNEGDFDSTDKFSFGAWINPDSNTGSPIARMDPSQDYRGWDMMLSDGRPAVHLISTWPSNALKVISKAMLPTHQWSSVWATYDGSGKPAGVHIYVNGKLTEQDVETDTLKGSIKTSVNLQIGQRAKSQSVFEGEIDDVALYRRTLKPDEIKSISSLSPVARLLSIPVSSRTAAQRAQISTAWSAENDPQFKATQAKFLETQDNEKKVEDSISTVMVMQEMPKPRDCYVLVRGQYDHHGPLVTAGVPAALPPLPKGVPNNRLGLAKWIVDPSNPLTSRVTVNRMWERLFGTGIVETSEDFGTRSEFPSHPELLDWLATELIRQKWNVKALWKEMVMSKTYRQSSDISAALLKVDPKNRLLARGPRFRLPAEVLRDQAMFAGGYLTEKVGGPSVRPYQPAGIWDDVSVYGNLHNYKHDMGPNLYRRSLYTIWKRTAAPPEMTLFDVPTREICRVKRARTDTPLQALVLLNDVSYMEAARGLAQRMIEHGGASPASRISYAYRILLDRTPTAAEQTILVRGLNRRIDHYQAKPEAAKALLKEGELPLDSHIKTPELAAYTVMASTLMNLDETVTKE